MYLGILQYYCKCNFIISVCGCDVVSCACTSLYIDYSKKKSLLNINSYWNFIILLLWHSYILVEWFVNTDRWEKTQKQLFQFDQDNKVPLLVQALTTTVNTCWLHTHLNQTSAYSSYIKLLDIITYVLRFIHNTIQKLFKTTNSFWIVYSQHTIDCQYPV